MKKFILFAICVIGITISANAQTADPCPAMPSGFVCLTRAAAQAALEAGDKAKALEAELKANQTAYATQKDVLEKMRIEFASVSGENTALRQNAVSDRAIIEVLLKYAKPKKFGLIVF